MSALFESVGWNTLAALGLAVPVLLAGRVWKRPELFHVLWVVVLVKLVTPGMIRVEAIPVPADPPAVAMAPVDLPVTVLEPTTVFASAAPPVSWTQVASAVWIAGSLFFLAVAAIRVRRFARALGAAVEPDAMLLDSIDRLAQRIGVARPRTRVVAAAVSPMVWCGVRGATLILPAGLMWELDAAERDALLAHELAHLKRGDCWVRWIELAVTAGLWWNPVVWWVRRNLRRAEEQACDRHVIELLPQAKRAYADGIVKTVEFLAGAGRAPLLATGATGTRHIQERLTMILDPSRPGRLRRPLVPALLIALLALPVIPGFAERDDASREADGAKAELYELEREALELEKKLQEIQLRRQEVERRLEVTRFKRDSAEMKRQVDELRRQGMDAAAAELEQDLARTEQQLSEEREWREQRLTEERAMHEAEMQWRESMIERERAVHEEDVVAAEAYERALRQREREMEDRHAAMREAEIAYEKARQLEHSRQIAAELKALEMQSRQLSEQGRDGAAAEVREQLRQLKGELARQKLEQEQQTQELMTVRAELLQRMELVGAEMGHADGEEREALEREFENLSRSVNEIDTELGRRETVR